MSDKRTRGNKEVKKPKQAPRVATPAAVGAHAPAQQASSTKPQPSKK